MKHTLYKIGLSAALCCSAVTLTQCKDKNDTVVNEPSPADIALNELDEALEYEFKHNDNNYIFVYDDYCGTSVNIHTQRVSLYFDRFLTIRDNWLKDNEALIKANRNNKMFVKRFYKILTKHINTIEDCTEPFREDDNEMTLCNLLSLHIEGYATNKEPFYKTTIRLIPTL